MKATKLPSGSYRVRITVDGKTYSFTDKDKKAALKQAKIFKEEVKEAIDNPTLKFAMEKYIKDNEKVLSASTIRNYKVMQRALLNNCPGFCSRHTVAIKPTEVQMAITSLGNSPKTYRNYLSFIQCVCDRTFKVRVPQKEKVEVNIPNDLEVAGLIRIFEGSEMEIPILLAAYGPLRRGEICALTLDDFDGDFVNITKDLVKNSDNEWAIKPPKTFSSNRKIKLPHFVVEKVKEKGHVTLHNPDYISHGFRQKQIRLGIEKPYNFHSLRHYCASTLHAQGIPDEYIMQRGGWSTASVLQGVYRHTLSDQTNIMSEKAIDHFTAVSNSVTSA